MSGEVSTVDTAPDHTAPEDPAPDSTEPDHTAVRVALWRALHLEVDAPPHVFEDDFALRLADPGPDWRRRPDMDPDGTRPFRAGVVSRARFVEDLVTEQAGRGVGQYVLLGAGLDTFVQRRPELAARLRVFEIDQPGTQAWKRRRLLALGHPVPEALRLVPVDFEAGQSWWDQLVAAGFDPAEPAVVASTGVSMYLAKETTRATLRRLAGLAAGSTVAMTFLLPPELLAEADRPGLNTVRTGAKASGTPFVSLYSPREMLEMARETGFTDIQHVPGTALSERYFAGRADGLRPSSGEDFLVATT
jgi:methyltransferase (TIGR00027 family)